ncbi:MAG: hypothetical protein FWD26_00980 [Treponema sp.]|nr:hypothetical protein [Treponema sp.]
MPWRLIVFIAVFALFLVFITFNLENKCDISFGFAKLEQVPIFITIFTMFVLGFICALPLVIHIKKRKKSTKKETKPNYIDTPVEPDDKIKQDAALARERFLKNRGGKND